VARVEVKLESVINGQGGLKSEVSKAKNWKCSTCENKESLLPGFSDESYVSCAVYS